MDKQDVTLEAYMVSELTRTYHSLQEIGFNFAPNIDQKTTSEQLIEFLLTGNITPDKNQLITKMTIDLKSNLTNEIFK